MHQLKSHWRNQWRLDEAELLPRSSQDFPDCCYALWQFFFLFFFIIIKQNYRRSRRTRSHKEKDKDRHSIRQNINNAQNNKARRGSLKNTLNRKGKTKRENNRKLSRRRPQPHRVSIISTFLWQISRLTFTRMVNQTAMLIDECIKVNVGWIQLIIRVTGLFNGGTWRSK